MGLGHLLLPISTVHKKWARYSTQSERQSSEGRFTMGTLLERFWSDWRIGLAIGVVLAAVAGLISAWLTPRGPVTTPEALVSMGAALLVGLVVGLVTGSRWSILVTTVVFVFTFELARLWF
jgi:Mg/Co/Ni transporter MgtE